MFTHHLTGEVQTSSVNLTQHRLARLFEKRQFHFWMIAAMSLLVLFSKLHIGDLGGYDDAVYAHEGKQMLVTGQWWNVSLNGQPDFDKPPMFVWLEAISMLVFGATDFAARFPAALLGFGTILLVYFIARELTASYWPPVWAMMILFGTHSFMRFAMRAMTDVPFTFFFALAVFFYLKGLKAHRHFVWCGLAIGFAILTRSILGAIPLGIILAHLMTTGRWRLLRSKSLISGLAGTLLAIGLPLIWFVSQYRLHGSRFLELHFSFTFQNLPLTNGKSSGQFGSGLFQYPIFLFESYWPWLPLMLAGLWMQAKKLFMERDSTSALLVIWVLAVIVPFSLAEFKWLRYIMPVFPAFAILAAIAINEWVTADRRQFVLKAAYAVLCLAMVGMAFKPKYRVRPEELRHLAPIAEAATDPERRILLYTEHVPRDAHLFQLIWYANRQCVLLDDINETIARLERNPNKAVIMDKEAFRTSIANSALKVRILGETEGFVCWTKSREAVAVKARHDVQPRASQPAGN